MPKSDPVIVPAASSAAKPGQAAGSGGVVILRESELDTDLATAIQRIRSEAGTKRSRILVIAAEDRTPPAPHDDASVPQIPPELENPSRKAEPAILEPLGTRLMALVGCLERFLDEGASAIRELDQAVEEEPRVRLKSHVKGLREIVDWTQAVAADLRCEAAAAELGMRLVETREVLVELAGIFERRFPQVRVHVAPADSSECFARAADLADAFYLALALTAVRIGVQGAITVEISRGPQYLRHRILGHGEPRPVHACPEVQRLRDLVKSHGGRLFPAETGPHGTGITIEIPLPGTAAADPE
jgi:hypothetical protein